MMQPPASINPAPSPPQLKTVDSTKLPPLLRGLRESQSYPQLPRFPEDVPASFGGHGTLEALDVTNLLEREGIVAAVCGVSALKYYGASRLRQDWEICVPTDKFESAEALFKSPAYSAEYVPIPPWPYAQPGSLHHIYPRFKRKGLQFNFVLIPDWDAHFECTLSNLQRSSNGLPYPKLHVLMQSYVDTQDQLSLCDLIDGADVSEQWGLENLRLDGGTDLAWARRKNKLIVEANAGDAYTALGVATQAIDRKELWEKYVRTKGGRRGWTQPAELFATQYRLHGSPDPWREHRLCS